MKLFGQTAADMPLVPPPLIKPTIAAIAIIWAVVKGPEHMLLKDAVAPRSANPIAAAARAYQLRGLAWVFHVAISQGHSNWRRSWPLPCSLEWSALFERRGRFALRARELRGSK